MLLFLYKIPCFQGTNTIKEVFHCMLHPSYCMRPHWFSIHYTQISSFILVSCKSHNMRVSMADAFFCPCRSSSDSLYPTGKIPYNFNAECSPQLPFRQQIVCLIREGHVNPLDKRIHRNRLIHNLYEPCEPFLQKMS